jgi:group I intron endonuclease
MDINRSGIYKIESPSGNFYIGSAVNIRRRWHEHKTQLNRGTHHSKQLQHAHAKYGLDALVFGVIEFCQIDDLIIAEQKWLDTLNPKYNSAKTAGSKKGVKWTDEQRVKIVAKLAGVKKSPEHVANAAAAKVGLKHSAESRAKMSAAAKNRAPMSAETKAKISSIAKLQNPTAETRSKISAGLIGRVMSPETRAKISASKLGKKTSTAGRKRVQL